MPAGDPSSNIVVEAYRGYGSAEEVRLSGRVHKNRVDRPKRHRHGLTRALSAIALRFLRGGVPGAVLLARAGGSEQRVSADRSGYFQVHLRLREQLNLEGCWGTVELELLEPTGSGAVGEVFVPPKSARCVVISDIDDTVMETGVANKLVMLWRLFAQQARSRTAFPGAAALLSALHEGVSGRDLNPMLYVSRAPWSLYPVLNEFFEEHRIPVGPVLYLRDWGLHRQHPLPRRSKGHKLSLIEEMLALYADLPFILIGDSGQRDPEIYAEVVQRHPNRVLAVYIRDVVRRPERSQAIQRLADQVVSAGSSLILAEDSTAMARDAEERGLVPPATSELIAREIDADNAAEA